MEAIAQFLGLDLPDSFFVISSGVVLVGKLMQLVFSLPHFAFLFLVLL